jgi:hypothetical protein
VRRNSQQPIDPEGRLVDSGVRTRNLAAMSGNFVEPYELTAGNGSSVDRGLIQFVSGSSLLFRKTGACVGFALFKSRETSPKARWCSLALALPLKPTTSPQWTICLRGSKREVAIGVWTWPLGHPRVASVIEARTRDK